MADTCDTIAVVETSKSDSAVETLPDSSYSPPESRMEESNAAAIPPLQIDAVSDSLHRAITDAASVLEKEPITGKFQSITPETSGPVPETPNVTGTSQITPNTALTENTTENPEAKNIPEEIATADSENSNLSMTTNAEPLATESANTRTDVTLETLVTENSNPSVTKNSELLVAESANITDATLETLEAENSNPSVTEYSELLATESVDTHTDATLETLETENSNPLVTEYSELLATESVDTHTDATLETLVTQSSNPSVTVHSEPLATESAETSVTELDAIHNQTEMIIEEADTKLDPTQNSKVTDSQLFESTDTEITQSNVDKAEMFIDKAPSTEITDTIKVKLEDEEIAAQPTETIISKESKAGEQFSASEQETEPIVSSATPCIKSEINEGESEDVEMAEPHSETSAITESQMNETSTVEINTEKDKPDGDQDEPMAQIQTDETAKGLPVNYNAPEESENEKDVEMGEGEGDGERTVTMLDVLQEQEELEDNADAVLGASDDKNCTYSEGYIKRQALYACLTCCSDAKMDPTKRAGVCLACSLSCHENHDLIELYTKRNFRCDCGNPNFNSQPCTFTKDKSEFNVDNKYNQNFSGLYCICHRPYPDPASTVDDEMIQCVVCEDWLHASHLGATVPANDQYSEMICKSCMDENGFLHDYTCYVVNIEDNEEVSVVNNPEKMNGIEDISLKSSEQTHIEYLPSTDIAVDVNSEEKSRDETIESSTKESTNEEFINKTDDGDLTDRSAEMDDSMKEAAAEEVPNNTSTAEESGETVNNLTTVFNSTESTINDDSTKVINDESSKALIEKTVEEIVTKDSTVENASKNVTEETAGETTTQDTTEENVQDSSSKNVIEETAGKTTTQDATVEKTQVNSSKNVTEQIVEELGAQDDTEEKMEDSNSKMLLEETVVELLTKGNTEEKMDESSNTHTDTENIAETNAEIRNVTTEIEMYKKVEEEDKNADNDEPVILSENTITTTVEIELKPQNESTETSSEIAQSSETGENVNQNKTSDEHREMLETDTSTTGTSVPTENIEKASANGEGLNAVSPNESNTDGVESVADSQTKREDDEKEIIPIQIEENTDKHSVSENCEQMINNINEDMQMAENGAATLPNQTDTKADASITRQSEQLKPTPLVEADNIGTDVEMKDHTVSTMSNIHEIVPQQQEPNQSDEALPEANKGPNTQAENNKTQVAEQQDSTENTNKRKLSSDISEDNEHVKRTKLDNGTNEDDGCKRPTFTGKRFKGATFWPCSWRKILCSCHNCVSMYRDKEILFLLDLEDTVSAYEDLGKEKSDGKLSQYEKGLRALSSLDRIQQINALTEYNKMKDELLNFLISFKNRQEVVKVEDIEKFFADIKPKKKSDGVYFCR